MSDDILRADARLRRVTWIALAVAAVLCVVAILAFQRWLAGIAPDMPLEMLQKYIRQFIALTVTGVSLCLALLAWLAARAGRRAVQARQWPIPGARVIRDTPIRRGEPAQRIGRQLQVLALVLLVFAAGSAMVSLRML
ncbi:hypothetical protein [Dokdonella sp.]|uniref:hypothetical protein n=1 Tax=Dokdonella sp. TaxID=2291710 RepID=UPI0025BC6330|nr:hypothetical protein [Dokdonella sp.]MBX3693391.1 hypothetical protein [Dokdonella sp.]MCW5569119.1 hypothetical protein [Dokdonella sp.]